MNGGEVFLKGYWEGEVKRWEKDGVKMEFR